VKRGFLFILLLVVNICSAQQHILTREAQALGNGLIHVGLGTELLLKKSSPFPQAPKSLWKIPTFTVRGGVSDNVNFELDWSGRLQSTADSNGNGSDWGDLTISTLITFISEDETTPALGMKTSVKLPSTSYLPYFLGSDQTDFYFTMLGSKHFSGIETRLNVGLGILGSPRELGSQDDIYIGSMAILFPLFADGKMFIEGYGYTGYRDDDDKILLRSGLTVSVSSIDLSLYGSVRIAGNNRDFAGAFLQSEDQSFGIMLTKEMKL
jgi:hypothetical protein